MKLTNFILSLLLVIFLIHFIIIILWKLSNLEFYDSTRLYVGISEIVKENQNDRLRAYKMQSYISQSKRLYLNIKFLKALKLVEPKVDSKFIVDRATKRPVDHVL